MKRGRVELLPEALSEIEAARDWYLERNAEAAAGLLKEIERGLSLLAETPHVWPLFESGTRKYVLSRYPYSIVYREKDDEIQIIALTHHRRKPRYWQKRKIGVR